MECVKKLYEVVKEEMKNRILIISVVIITFVLLATITTASSEANNSGKVWSDGYVELTLDKMERTETPTYGWLGPPKEGHDVFIVDLTISRIEGRHVLLDAAYEIRRNRGYEFSGFSFKKSLLFDVEGGNYTPKSWGCSSLGMKNGHPPEYDVNYTEAFEGSKLFLRFEVPKDREPVVLRFIYGFTESWEKVSLEEGEIEIDFHATPDEKGVPGFEAVSAIAGLLAVAWLLRRRK